MTWQTRIQICPHRGCGRGFRSPEALERHLEAAHATGGEEPLALTGWIVGRPVPWQRTREGRRLDPRYAAWREKAVLDLRRQHDGRPITVDTVAAVAVTPTGIAVRYTNLTLGLLGPARNRAMPLPTRIHRPAGYRGDLDNYVKAVLDVSGLRHDGAGWIGDDRQIVCVLAWFGDGLELGQEKVGRRLGHHPDDALSRPSTQRDAPTIPDEEGDQQ